MTRDELVAGAFTAIQAGSKSFRAASRLFDRTTRERAWLLYCWCRRCDDLCDGQVAGFAGGETRPVDDLRERTNRALAGERTGELAFDCLAQLLEERPIPRSLISDHLDGFELDESGWSPRDEAELYRYCYHVAGAVGCMMAIVMGIPADDEPTLERAADLGIAFQLSNIARDIREDLDAGRCYLPSSWLEEFGIGRNSLFDPGNEAALVALTRRLVDTVATYEASARAGVERLPFRSRLAVLMALRIYGAIGREVGRRGAGAWNRRVSVGRARKLAYLVPSLAEAIAVGQRS